MEGKEKYQYLSALKSKQINRFIIMPHITPKQNKQELNCAKRQHPVTKSLYNPE